MKPASNKCEWFDLLAALTLNKLIQDKSYFGYNLEMEISFMFIQHYLIWHTRQSKNVNVRFAFSIY